MMFQAYLDDEVSPAERAAVEQRCEESPENAAVLKQHKRTCVRLYDTLQEYRMQGSLRQRVMDNLPEMDRRTVELQAVNYRAKHSEGRFQRAMRWMPAVAASLIIAMALVLQLNWPGASAGLDTVGVVAAVKAPAHHVSSESLERSEAAARDFVERGDIVETGPAGHCMIRVASNSSAKLSANTRLEVKGARHMRLVKGKAYFDVGRHSRLFRVETQQADITVFGTQFEVALSGDMLSVSVGKGEVKVENEAGWQVLKEGEQSIVVAQGKPSTPQAFRTQLLAWANSIIPDPAAEELYISQVALPAESVEINGVEVNMLDASHLGSEQRVRSIRIRWTPNTRVSGHCAVDVYVNNNQNSPIFKHRIDPSVFVRRGINEYSVPVPDDISDMPQVFNVRLVPDWSTGTRDSLLTTMQVSAVAGGA